VYVKPKKHLGQHFLRNDSICERIAQSVTHPDSYQSILEIGPGTGALTRHLLRSNDKQLYLSEIDRESIAWLRVHFPEIQQRILEEDILRLPLPDRISGQVAVVGNFPYNISSQILFWVLMYREFIPIVVGMFQKEVAVRITGSPGNKDYGILSVFIQSYYDTEYLFTVDEHEFDPPPRVKSGVIRLIRKTEQPFGCDEKLFRNVVKTTFNQRRKTLRNSIKSLIPGTADTSDPIFGKRPEQLAVEDFKHLTRMVSTMQQGDR